MIISAPATQNTNRRSRFHSIALESKVFDEWPWCGDYGPSRRAIIGHPGYAARFDPAFTGLLEASTPANQVEDKDDDRNNDQDVDQAAADVERETQEPQNDENYKDCPKHDCSFASGRPKS
jgi:hypothetical protein